MEVENDERTNGGALLFELANTISCTFRAHQANVSGSTLIMQDICSGAESEFMMYFGLISWSFVP